MRVPGKAGVDSRECEKRAEDGERGSQVVDKVDTNP